jgi:hypothetical protein
MTELIICAIIVLLAVALSVYSLTEVGNDLPQATSAEQWWWTLSM